MSGSLKIVRVSGKTLAAVVTGVDLANLDEKTFAQIDTAFMEHGVLVFPDQHLTQEAQIAFAKRFGTPENLSPKREGMEHYMISNRRRNGELLKDGEEAFVTRIGTEVWHYDSTFREKGTNISCLMALESPTSGGGQTGFADMRAAYDAFDQETKDAIEKLCAYHSNQYSNAILGVYDDMGFSEKAYNKTGTAYLRPLVKRHPVTGRPAFFAARHAFGIPGMSLEESEQLLEDLNARSTSDPSRIYEHDWKVGDLVLWDNRCILHRARPFDPNQPRVMRGVRNAGDETDLSIQGSALAGRERLLAEVQRLQMRKDFVFGKTLPKAAL